MSGFRPAGFSCDVPSDRSKLSPLFQKGVLTSLLRESLRSDSAI
jgi:hypothetical protein